MREPMRTWRKHPHPGPPRKGEGKEGVAPSQGFPSAGLRPDPPLRSGWSGSGDRQNDPLLVMPGLVPGIHVLPQGEGVDGRDKSGYDDHERSCPVNFVPTLFLTSHTS